MKFQSGVLFLAWQLAAAPVAAASCQPAQECCCCQQGADTTCAMDCSEAGKDAAAPEVAVPGSSTIQLNKSTFAIPHVPAVIPAEVWLPAAFTASTHSSPDPLYLRYCVLRL